MSYPYQNPNYHQTPNPNPPQQPGRYIQPGQFYQPGQPLPNTYNDPGQQGILSSFFFWKADGLMLSSRAYSYYPEDSLQPQPPSGRRHSSRSPNVGNISFPEDSLQPQPPSGQRYSSRSPNVGNISFPEPHYDGSASHPPAYFPPSQTTPNLTVPTHHQHGRRGSHGHSPTGSYSDGQGLYSAGAGSDTGSGGNFYPPQPGVQPHYEGDYTATATQPQAVYDEGHDSRSKAPPSRPADYSSD